MFNGKIHYKWPFSIAMLNYQRVIWQVGWACGIPHFSYNLQTSLDILEGAVPAVSGYISYDHIH
jgi:hypothetical protein